MSTLWLRLQNEVNPYRPHLTVGRLSEKSLYDEALSALKDFRCEFTTIVETISVEMIDDQEKSHIEFNHRLT